MDWTLHEVTDDHAVLRSAKGVGPYLEFLRTPDVKTVPDRVHLDLLPYPGDDQAAEAARLRALGATGLDVGQGDVPWTCASDPERSPPDSSRSRKSCGRLASGSASSSDTIPICTKCMSAWSKVCIP